MRDIFFEELFIASTDTVVGIGGPVSPENKVAINIVKQRSIYQPIVIMVGSIEQARSFNEWDVEAEKLAKVKWPGSTTLVLSKEIALRMPDDNQLIRFLKENGPMYMTSANVHGEEPKAFIDAIREFPEIKNSFDFNKGNKIPSEILNVKTKEVIRSATK